MSYTAAEISPSIGNGCALTEAWYAAFLFTSSAARAERAILRAVAAMGRGGLRLECVLREAALEPMSYLENGREESEWPKALPQEMRRVLKLSAPLRRCYVLRILAGQSKQASARMVRLPIHELDVYTAAAVRCLARSPARSRSPKRIRAKALSVFAAAANLNLA